MSLHISFSRRRLLQGIAALMPSAVWAQSSPADPPASGLLADLQGTSSNGQRLSLDALRGKVVLVFFWSTNCAVCRSKMPELRANAAGWNGQNFALLGVNMDEEKSDFLLYEKIVTPLLPAAQRFPSVWGLDPEYRDSFDAVKHLPSAVLIDKAGRIVERYSGRIPPQAWDRIADLL